MAPKLIFDGRTHQITLIGSNGEAQGTWPAYNNVASPVMTIEVTNNNAPMARAASSRNRDRHLQGRHHA